MQQLGQGRGEPIRFDRVRGVRLVPCVIFIIMAAIAFAVIIVGGKGDGISAEAETTGYQSLTVDETSIENQTTNELYEEETTEAETACGFETTSEEQTTESIYKLKDLYGVSETYSRDEFTFSGDRADIEQGKPTVLILHTHTSEAYSDSNGRSSDTAQNVTAVGAAFAGRLSENGICAIHCTVPFDSQTTMGAYSRAAEVIENYLRTYPDIVCVVDIHRMADTVNGQFIITKTDSNGASQVRFIISDANDTSKEKRNIAAAVEMCRIVNEKSPICAPISVGEGIYNHDTAANFGKYMLTIEIGAVGNTVDQAKKASVCLADALSKMLYGTE